MQPTSQEEVLPMQVPSPGLAAEAVQFFWQVTKCGAGLELAVPCKVSSLCATQTRGIGNPFCTLNSLTINCTTAWFEIPLFNTYWGKTPSHSIDKSSQPSPAWALSGAPYRLRRQQQILPSQPPTQQSAHPVSQTRTHSERRSLPASSAELITLLVYRAHTCCKGHLLPPTSLSALPKL